MKKALLQMNLAVVLWGFTGVLGRAITLDAAVLVWYRMLLTAIMIAMIISYRKQWQKIEKKDLQQMIWVGCLMAVHWVAFYGSIKLANASIALICLSTASIFTTLTESLLRKQPPNMGELGIGLLALSGVFVMYIAPRIFQHTTTTDMLPDRNLGILCGVFAAVLSAIFTVLNKKIAHKYPVRLMVFYEMGTGWMLLTLLFPLIFLQPSEVRLLPHLWDWIWLLVLSLCCTVWAQSLALNALKHISSFTATLSVNLEPIYGVILAFLIYQENKELGWGFYLGMSIILLSVLLQVFRLLKPKHYIKEKGAIE